MPYSQIIVFVKCLNLERNLPKRVEEIRQLILEIKVISLWILLVMIDITGWTCIDDRYKN